MNPVTMNENVYRYPFVRFLIALQAICGDVEHIRVVGSLQQAIAIPE